MSAKSSDELRDLYKRYASVVHSRCVSILKSEDDAWDATQEVFIKLNRALPSIRNKNAIFYWLMSASTNHCISVLRRKKTVEFDEAVHRPAKEPGMSAQEKRLVMKEILKHYFMPWNKKVREVLFYTYIDGYKQQEIAKLTGLGESTIRKYLTGFRRACGTASVKPEEVI
ncbi:RNA polymerase sigma factor [Chitinispirillum alkaliphilum]|nr:RNA polymerase sigma factor [Chitinispirillum alkaliphilum]